MISAYKIGITVALTNQVSNVLGLISRQFMTANANATALTKNLKTIQTYGAIGVGLGALGYMGLKGVGAAVKAGDEYIHQLGILRRAGLSEVDIAQSVSAAWKNTSTVLTTSATDNLKTLIDLRNILSDVNGLKNGAPIDMSMALRELPVISKIQAVMAASKEGALNANAEGFAFSMAKALDIIGAASSPERFEREAEKMAKVITALQGRVTPSMFQQTFQYARQGKFDLSDEFKYEILPTLMLEASSGSGAGGGSRGVGPGLAAMYRITNQGYVNKAAVPELQKLGLIGATDQGRKGKFFDQESGKIMNTTTTTTMVPPLKGHELAATNPYKWINDIVIPAIKRVYGPDITEQDLRYHLNQITRGNQLAASMFVEFATKQSNFLRDQKIIQGAMPYEQAYRDAITTDPNLANQALAKQWDNLKTAFGVTVVPMIVTGMMGLTKALNGMAIFFHNNPGLAKAITLSVAGLSGLTLLGGIVFTVVAAFKALGLVLTLGGVTTLGTVALWFSGIAVALGVLGAAYELWVHRTQILDSLKGAFSHAAAAPGNQLPPWATNAPTNAANFFRAAGSEAKEKVANVEANMEKMFSKIDESINALRDTKIEMDGRTVGQIVMGGVVAEWNKPPRMTSGFDPNQSLSHP